MSVLYSAHYLGSGLRIKKVKDTHLWDTTVNLEDIKDPTIFSSSLSVFERGTIVSSLYISPMII